jgi:hypothetical protein
MNLRLPLKERLPRFFTIVALLLLAGCRRDMVSQARVDPLKANSFFSNGAGARPLPANTIAQGQLNADTLFYTGHTDDGQLSTIFPEPVTRPMLERGAERYGIYCTPCHGPMGDGRGIIVGHGFPAPPTFHQPRLRDAPPGYYHEVITKGLGLMYPYASRVPPADRWAIAAYIRALQLSQDARPSDAPPGALPP